MQQKRSRKWIVWLVVALVVIGLCVAAVLYVPTLVEMVKRMHGMG